MLTLLFLMLAETDRIGSRKGVLMLSNIRDWANEAAKVKKFLRNTIAEAGLRIMDIYDGDFDVEYKDDRSPLTQADMAAHHCIDEELRNLDGPGGSIPVLSEEGGIPGFDVRRKWEAWWLVDPLDGTKEFVKRNGEFTVNIALMARDQDGVGVPVAGWVYAPVTGLLYEGILTEGSVRLEADRTAGAMVFHHGSSVPLPIHTAEPGDAPRIVASRSHGSGPTESVISTIAEKFGDGGTITSGSSLKFCLVAEGSAEIYPRPAPTMEWDTAAADAVCRAAGVQVVDVPHGRPLIYGTEGLKNPWFVAARDGKLLEAARAVWSV